MPNRSRSPSGAAPGGRRLPHVPVVRTRPCLGGRAMAGSLLPSERPANRLHCVGRSTILPTTAATLQPRVDRLALEGQHAGDTLVDAPERLAADEPREPLDAQRELPQGQRPLGPEPAA